MNTKEVEILIGKYFEGLTSLEEERLLKDFFAAGDFPAEMMPVAAMFGYFEIEKEVKTSSQFSANCLLKVEAIQHIPFYQKPKFWFYFSGVAASIIFLITIFFKNPDKTEKPGYNSQQAQQAYLQTKKTLAYVSLKLNMGVQPLNEIGKIDQNIQKMEQLSKFSQNINKVNNNIQKMESGIQEISKISKLNIILNQ